jgi:hypothetical protein
MDVGSSDSAAVYLHKLGCSCHPSLWGEGLYASKLYDDRFGFEISLDTMAALFTSDT